MHASLTGCIPIVSLPFITHLEKYRAQIQVGWSQNGVSLNPLDDHHDLISIKSPSNYVMIIDQLADRIAKDTTCFTPLSEQQAGAKLSLLGQASLSARHGYAPGINVR